MTTETFCVPHQIQEEYLAPSAFGFFVRNDAYATIAERVRDFEYAPTHIADFADDIGHSYQLWTKQADYEYHDTCLAQAGDEVFVSIYLDDKQAKNSIFVLHIVIHDGSYDAASDALSGVFVSCRQAIACQKITPPARACENPQARTVGWRKIPSIRDFVESR